MSDAKEMENLSQIAAKRNSPPPETAPSGASADGPTPASTSPLLPPRAGGSGKAMDAATKRMQETSKTRCTSPLVGTTVGHNISSGERGDTFPSTGEGMTAAPATRALQEGPGNPLAEGSGGGVGGSGNQETTRGAPEEENEEGGEEEPWGVVLRNTIIRDLAGFGMEHAGPIGRSLISKVLATSQDNYPEMVSVGEGCAC